MPAPASTAGAAAAASSSAPAQQQQQQQQEQQQERSGGHVPLQLVTHRVAWLMRQLHSRVVEAEARAAEAGAAGGVGSGSGGGGSSWSAIVFCERKVRLGWSTCASCARACCLILHLPGGALTTPCALSSRAALTLSAHSPHAKLCSD